MNAIQKLSKKHFPLFSEKDLPNRATIVKALCVFIGIAVISFLFCILANSLLISRPNLMKYLVAACDQGISVCFWNILISVGIILWGVMFLFPTSILAKLATAVLSSANSACPIMAGMVLGKAVSTVSPIQHSWVLVWGFGLGYITFLGIISCIMAVTWLLTYLPGQPEFLVKVRQTSIKARVFVSALCTSPLVWAYTKG